MNKNEGIALGGTMILGGLIMLPSNPQRGGALLGAGVSATLYSISTNDQDKKYSRWSCLKEASLGAATSLITGAVGAQVATQLAKQSSVVVAVAKGVVSSAVTVSIKVLKGESVNVLGEVAAGSIGSLIGAQCDKILKPQAMTPAIRVINDGITGGVSAGTNQVVKNVFEKEKWSKNVKDAALVGGLVSSAASLSFEVDEHLKYREQAPSTTAPAASNPSPSAPAPAASNPPPSAPAPSLSQENKNWNNAYDKIKKSVDTLLKGGYKDNAHWARENSDTTINRVMNGESVTLRRGDETFRFKIRDGKLTTHYDNGRSFLNHAESTETTPLGNMVRSSVPVVATPTPPPPPPPPVTQPKLAPAPTPEAPPRATPVLAQWRNPFNAPSSEDNSENAEDLQRNSGEELAPSPEIDCGVGNDPVDEDVEKENAEEALPLPEVPLHEVEVALANVERNSIENKLNRAEQHLAYLELKLQGCKRGSTGRAKIESLQVQVSQQKNRIEELKANLSPSN